MLSLILTNLHKILQINKTNKYLNRLNEKNMKNNILDASMCESFNEIIDLIEQDMKRRKTVSFKVKKWFKKMF